MVVKPTLVALWLVDAVERDEETGRTNLVGVFNEVSVPPGADEFTVPFTVFFSVTDVRTRTACRLTMSSLETLDVVYERTGFLDPTPPDEVSDMTFRVNRLPLLGVGAYRWELFCGDEPLGATRLAVTERPEE